MGILCTYSIFDTFVADSPTTSQAVILPKDHVPLQLQLLLQLRPVQQRVQPGRDAANVRLGGGRDGDEDVVRAEAAWKRRLRMELGRRLRLGLRRRKWLRLDRQGKLTRVGQDQLVLWNAFV